MRNDFIEIKAAFGRYMGEFFNQMIPTHDALLDMRGRGLSKSVLMVKDRMIDDVTKMMEDHRANAKRAEMPRAQLPVIFIAMAKDSILSGADYTPQVAAPVSVTFENDPHKRAFKLSVMGMQRRVQLVFAAAEETTARSMGTQFLMWSARPENRRFTSRYEVVQDVMEHFPVVLESSEMTASLIDVGQVNMTVLTVDLNLRESVPFVHTPENARGEYPRNSAGYPLVTRVVVNDVSAQTHDVIESKVDRPVRRQGLSDTGVE